MDRSGSRRRAIGVVAVLALGVAACSSSGDGASEAPTTSAPSTSVASTEPAGAPAQSAGPVTPSGTPTDLVTGLDAPWSIAFVGDTPLVSERDTGRILEVLADGSVREVAVVDGISHGGEGGLLGLAVDGSNLFVYSSGSDGNRIERFPITGTAGSLALGPPTTLLGGLPKGGIHNGGRLAFGPDGMLYVTVGNAGQSASAQDLEYLGGKILRMTRDGQVPAGNPFPGSYVWSYGHRNPQGLAWTADGTMWATEFGQDTWDELNVITPGSDYGWPVVEGIAGREGFVDPVQQWRPSEASPSGMVAVGGTLFIPNLRGQVLRAVPVSDPSTATELYQGRYGRLRAVALAPDGDLWIVTNNTDGRGNPRAGDDRILQVPLVPAS